MQGVNKVLLIGTVGDDVEVRSTGEGISVANFSVATNEHFKDSAGNRQERAEWHRIVVWSKLADICGQYLKKGARVYIEGRLQTRKYTDKAEIERSITEIVADEVQFLDRKPAETAGQ